MKAKHGLLSAFPIVSSWAVVCKPRDRPGKVEGATHAPRAVHFTVHTSLAPSQRGSFGAARRSAARGEQRAREKKWWEKQYSTVGARNRGENSKRLPRCCSWISSSSSSSPSFLFPHRALSNPVFRSPLLGSRRLDSEFGGRERERERERTLGGGGGGGDDVMETEPFDEAELLALPASPVASPPRRLKRLKKSSQIAIAAHPVVGSPPPPSPPPPPPLDEETLAQFPSPPTNPSPPRPPPLDADADAAAEAAPSPALTSPPPNPSSSPLPPTDTTEEEEEEEEDDGLDPLFSETFGAVGWDPLGMPRMEGEGDEEEMLGGGLIEELRREKSAKKRLDMDEGEEGGGEIAMDAEVKGKRSKRRKKDEAPKDSARGKKRSEKVI